MESAAAYKNRICLFYIENKSAYENICCWCISLHIGKRSGFKMFLDAEKDEQENKKKQKAFQFQFHLTQKLSCTDND